MTTHAKRTIAAGLAWALASSTVLATPTGAFAVESSTYSDQVEACTTAYHEAEDRLAELNAQMEENSQRILDLEAELPEQRARAAQSLRTMYKFNQSGNGLLDLVLSADDFNEFISTVRYLDSIQTKNVAEVNALVELSDQLDIAQATLETAQLEAAEQVEAARQALEDAEAAREAARQAAIAQSVSEQQERQAALAEARQRAGETFTTATGREVVVEATMPTANVLEEAPQEQAAPAEAAQEQPAEEQKAEEQKAEDQKAEEQPAEEPEAAEPQEPSETQEATSATQTSTSTSTVTTDARENFINVWAPRIDAFNAGWPLDGYGSTFAAAAYDYGVDPRWSPAIARLESSSGMYCFADHNAWGWGSSEWPDWETAITSHVRGLAQGYGYTLTYEAAETYCPGTGGLWYSTVGSYMTDIWPTDQL